MYGMKWILFITGKMKVCKGLRFGDSNHFLFLAFFYCFFLNNIYEIFVWKGNSFYSFTSVFLAYSSHQKWFALFLRRWCHGYFLTPSGPGCGHKGPNTPKCNVAYRSKHFHQLTLILPENSYKISILQ